MTTTDDRLATAGLVDDTTLPELPDTFLEQLRATAADPGTPTLVPAGGVRRRVQRRRWVVRTSVGLVAAAVTTVLVVGVGSPGEPGGPPTAFAGWSAVPAAAQPIDAPTLMQACTPGIANGADRDSLDVVVADARGPWTFAVLTSSAAVHTCLLDPGGSSATASIGGQESWIADRLPSRLRIGGWGAAEWNDPPAAWAHAWGRVGPDVAAVSVELADGDVVEATVDGGWWAAWWPGRLPQRFSRDRITLLVTDTEGRTTTTLLTEG